MCLSVSDLKEFSTRWVRAVGPNMEMGFEVCREILGGDGVLREESERVKKRNFPYYYFV